jgi:hypothetical protein
MPLCGLHSTAAIEKSIGQKATGDAPAKSAEEWFQNNCRGLWRNIEE